MPGYNQAINGSTLVYGVIGYPVAHSFSPAVQNAAFNVLGLNSVYIPFSPAPEYLAQAISGIKTLGISGVNITIPYKEAVMTYLDEIDPDALAYGAVNTIVNRQGVLVGYNTDGPGLIKDLQVGHGFVPEKGAVLILGAGGAARAAVVSLARAGCRSIVLVNRNKERSKALAKELSGKTGLTIPALPWDKNNPQLTSYLANANLIVNCTSAGMAARADFRDGGQKANEINWPLADGLPVAGQLAYDLVYNPPQTSFMLRAQSSGAKAANGLGMLLYQGALALELWTGLSAPLKVMREALYKQMGNI